MLDLKMHSFIPVVIAIMLLHVSSLAAQGSQGHPLKVNAVVLPGQSKTCPADNIESPRADLRSEVDRLVQEISAPLERPCSCGAAIAGWRRVAFVNMTDSSQICPGEWRLLVSNSKRTCERSVNNGSSVASFSSGGQTYHEVCGRVVGYQLGTTDALWHPINIHVTPDRASTTLNVYDGGVLITHGNISRQHIWSLVSGFSQQTMTSLGCPCNIGSTVTPQRIPGWLGQDYFCDSAVVDSSIDHVFYTDNPLWDGVGCDESHSTCCQFNNPPWFCKQLPQPTSDDIEVWLSADHSAEGTPIELLEMYVR